eukprot:1041118-Alexandrium_andersonii.AAC.1
MAGSRDPIPLAPLLPAPARSSATRRASSGAAEFEKDVIELTNRAVVGLQQLWSGRLDQRLLAHDLVAEARGRSRAGRR